MRIFQNEGFQNDQKAACPKDFIKFPKWSPGSLNACNAGLGAANTDDQWDHRIPSSCNRDHRIQNLQLTSRTFPSCLMFNELKHAIDPFATKITHHWIRHRQEVHGHSINWSRNFLSRAWWHQWWTWLGINWSRNFLPRAWSWWHQWWTWLDLVSFSFFLPRARSQWHWRRQRFRLNFNSLTWWRLSLNFNIHSCT